MPRSLAKPIVAVFGSSEPLPESAAYRDAYSVGRLLGEAGYTLMNGGYGGVMEASARGAHDAGGETIGVTVAAFTGRQGPNQFIGKELREPDLYGRTRRLIDDAAAFIIMPGGSGTLAELAFLWAQRKAGLLGPRPIVVLGTVMHGMIGELRRLGVVGKTETTETVLIGSPEEAVSAVRRLLGPARR